MLFPELENLMAMGKDKLKRFSEILTFDNVFQPKLEDIQPHFKFKGKWHEHFKNNNPIIIELGCGKGEYTVGLAKLFPEIIKEYPKIRKSTANEINRICSELDFIIIEKNNLVNQIKKNEKVNS